MKQVILVLCWSGVIQSALLGIFFLSKGLKQKTTFILGLILIMTSIRVAKSTLYLFSDPQTMMVLNAGFIAHAFLGPLFLFYVQSLGGGFEWSRKSILHLVPPIVLMFAAPFLTLDNFWYKGGYSTLLFYTLIYTWLGWRLFTLQNKNTRTLQPVMFLLLALSAFQLSYFSNYILRLTDYSTGPVLHSILIFIISFLVLRDNTIFNKEKKKKYNNLNLTEEELKRHRDKIYAVMTEAKPYLRTDFSLATLSESTGTAPYILSYVFSEAIQQNFIHFVNTYRIEEAKKMLVDPSKNHLSIAGIAVDCGFNTLSSFNAAFKKIAGMTPSEYKKGALVHS